MRLKVTVRHGHVNDGVRSYVESKFAKLGRRLHDETLVEVVLDRERNPKIPDDHLVEAEVHMKGPNLHGREAAATYEAAADVLVDKLERQIERRRDKVVREPRRRAQAAPAEPMPVERIEESLRATSDL
jgi:putative sigma-54 modulation protein